MFHTYPEAEQFLPSGLATFGERSWKWVELSLQVPYFLLAINITSESCTFRRHFVFSEINGLLNLIACMKDEVEDIDISLLSPSYMNNSDSYQLGKIKEIWQNRDGLEQAFVMSDGTKLYYPSSVIDSSNQKMELIASF